MFETAVRAVSAKKVLPMSIIAACRHRGRAVVLSIITVIAAGCAGLSSFPARGDDPLVLALAGPMVGTSFSVGRQYQTGVTAAWEAAGRAVLGRAVEISALDDACTDTLAASVARKLAESKPAVVIGHSCSAATLAAAPIYADAGILQITPASTNPKVTEMGVGTIFRMIGRDDRQGAVAAGYFARRFPGKRIVILHATNAYGRGLAATTEVEMRRLGMSPVAVMPFEPSRDSYLSMVEQVSAAQPDAAYLLGGALDSAVIVRQIRQMGGTFPIIGGDTMVSEVFLKTADAYAEGVRFTFPPEPMELPGASGAVAAVRAKGVEPIGYTLLAYAAFEVWREGVIRAGKADGAAVAQAIRQGPINTILGPVKFDEKGDIITDTDPFIWYEWRDGKRARSTD